MSFLPRAVCMVLMVMQFNFVLQRHVCVLKFVHVWFECISVALENLCGWTNYIQMLLHESILLCLFSCWCDDWIFATLELINNSFVPISWCANGPRTTKDSDTDQRWIITRYDEFVSPQSIQVKSLVIQLSWLYQPLAPSRFIELCTFFKINSWLFWYFPLWFPVYLL